MADDDTVKESLIGRSMADFEVVENHELYKSNYDDDDDDSESQEEDQKNEEVGEIEPLQEANTEEDALAKLMESSCSTYQDARKEMERDEQDLEVEPAFLSFAVEDEDQNPDEGSLQKPMPDASLAMSQFEIPDSKEFKEKEDPFEKSDEQLPKKGGRNFEYEEIDIFADAEGNPSRLSITNFSLSIGNKNENISCAMIKEPKIEEIVVNNQVFENNALNLEEDKVEDDIREKMKYMSLEDKRAVEELHQRNKEEIQRHEEIVRLEAGSVHTPVFANKVGKFAGKEMKNEDALMSLANKLKSSVFGLSEEQKDEMMRIDEEIILNSNMDVLLAKPGCVVKKVWRMKNLGMKKWPNDTRIVSVTDGLYFEAPYLKTFASPGEMMEVACKIYVPEEEAGEGEIKEYIMRLYSNDLK